MANNLFISTRVEQTKSKKMSEIIEKFKLYAEKNLQEQIYLINAPLIEDKYEYDYMDNVMVVLSTRHKIIFIHL